MAIKSEVAIEGDSKGFNTVGNWYCGACNADTRRGRISSKFLLVPKVIASDLSLLSTRSLWENQA